MRTKGHQSSAAVKRWMTQVADSGSIVSGDSEVILHHCAGVTAKSNKVLVGPFWILPLTPQEHDWIHRDLLRFKAEAFIWGDETRKEVEIMSIEQLVEKIGQGEMPDQVFEAIKGYSR